MASRASSIQATQAALNSYYCSLSVMSSPSTSSYSRGCPAWLLVLLKQREESRFIPQRYRSITDFFQQHRLTPPSKNQWRLTKRSAGEFLACPHSFGVLTATDGILAFTELSDDSVFLGHIGNFVEMELEDEELPKPVKKEKSVNIERYV